MTKPTRPESREVGSPKEEVYFGVDWDSTTIQVLNAIVMDIMSYQRFIPNTSSLVVVCKEAKFLKRVSAALNIRVEDSASEQNKCSTWKLYWVEACPAVPNQATTCFEKQVTTLERNTLVMRKGDPRYPSLERPGDSRMVPPGKSPNVNRIPPRVHRGQPSVLYAPY